MFVTPVIDYCAHTNTVHFILWNIVTVMARSRDDVAVTLFGTIVFGTVVLTNPQWMYVGINFTPGISLRII